VTQVAVGVTKNSRKSAFQRSEITWRQPVGPSLRAAIAFTAVRDELLLTRTAMRARDTGAIDEITPVSFDAERKKRKL